MTRTQRTGRSRLRQNRRGFALALALATIVIIAALVAGVFFASTQEFRIGRNSLLQTRAMTAADYGLNQLLVAGEWDGTWNGKSAGLVGTKVYSPGDGSVDTVRITKISDGVFQVTSEGRVGQRVGAQVRQRVGLAMTLNSPTINMRAAITTRGQMKVGGSSFTDGNDSSVANWNCPPPGANKPGIAMPDSTKISATGCGGLSCITGSPKVSQDPLANNDSTYNNFGSLDWAALTAMASRTVTGGSTLTGLGPSVNADGSCNSSDQSNWGDPLHTNSTYAQCQGFFPIIHATGDLHISGGVGQGILLVDNDLTVSGGFEFFGPVIVHGSMKTTGTGGHFTGGVLSANTDLEQSTLLGDAVVQYSSCALSKALLGAGIPIPDKGRSWTPLY